MKRILLILASLIIILAVLLVVWNRGKKEKEGIIIKQNGHEKVLTFSEIDKLPKHDFSTNRGDNFSGILLQDLLTKYDYSNLILHSSDGGNLRFSSEDIANSYFIEMDNSAERNFRLIIPTDEFGQRWMKYIKTIELQ